ncbi:hypothetical protein [Arachidicoccus soli]|uniref:hypothetical protein n=1 Tax=Arachidicoccus soli TaxID=2341117 RepID=UPI001968DBDB|nr:hypothetical protein [Arachidicoccus soli]
MKLSDSDPIGLYETMIEYYTGRDASQMTDEALILKLGHLQRIRQMEHNQSAENILQIFGKNGQ